MSALTHSVRDVQKPHRCEQNTGHDHHHAAKLDDQPILDRLHVGFQPGFLVPHIGPQSLNISFQVALNGLNIGLQSTFQGTQISLGCKLGNGHGLRQRGRGRTSLFSGEATSLELISQFECVESKRNHAAIVARAAQIGKRNRTKDMSAAHRPHSQRFWRFR